MKNTGKKNQININDPTIILKEMSEYIASIKQKQRVIKNLRKQNCS